MKYLKYTGYGLGGLLICFVVVGLVLPSKIQVERNAMINAGPEDVFAAIASFKEFNSWSPWATIDPNTKYTFEGPDTGVGSKMAWSSEDPSVGKGSSEVTAIEPNKRVTVALNFEEQGDATYNLRLEPQETGTKVTWDFETDLGMNLLARYFGLFMDDMIAQSYEEGLTTLKNQVETQVAQRSAAPEVAGTTPPPTDTPASTESTTPTTETMPAFAGNQ